MGGAASFDVFKGKKGGRADSEESSSEEEEEEELNKELMDDGREFDLLIDLLLSR